MNEVDEQSTAYPHRESTHLFELATQWQSLEDDEEMVSWAASSTRRWRGTRPVTDG